MADPNCLVDQCVHKGLKYLAKSLQHYWPANYPHENNIALHLARSFTEKGFQAWAEIPMRENRQEALDFLAHNYTEDITAALEFKGCVEQPENNIKDLERLIAIHNNKAGFEWGWPTGCGWPADTHTKPAKRRIYGIVTFHHAEEFVDWWKMPKSNDYMPLGGRRAPNYGLIGKAIDVACRGVVDLKDFSRYCNDNSKYRFRYAAYALFDENSINKLATALKTS